MTRVRRSGRSGRRQASVVRREGSRRPRVVAHRGSSSRHAEHTLMAYQHALEEGAEALECDVRLTADGHLVCVHDRRVDRTSNGRGIVSTLELADLDALDWASWKRPWYELDDEAPELDPPNQALTLSRLLDLVTEWGRPVDLFIEMKHPNRYGGLLEERVVQLLRDRRVLLPAENGATVRLMSFSWMAVSRLEGLAPELQGVVLMRRLPARARWLSRMAGVDIVGPSIDLLRESPELADELHDAGLRVFTYTVNDAAGFELCAQLGVDFMATDKPGEAIAYFTTR